MGIDGGYLSKNDITEEELTEEFQIESKFRRKVIMHCLADFKQTSVKMCNMGYLCVHLTFDKINTSTPPSSEYVRARVNKLMAYESARQLLGTFDSDVQSFPTPQEALTGGSGGVAR